jgi:hypothetical protein
MGIQALAVTARTSAVAGRRNFPVVVAVLSRRPGGGASSGRRSERETDGWRSTTLETETCVISEAGPAHDLHSEWSGREHCEHTLSLFLADWPAPWARTALWTLVDQPPFFGRSLTPIRDDLKILRVERRPTGRSSAGRCQFDSCRFLSAHEASKLHDNRLGRLVQCHLCIICSGNVSEVAHTSLAQPDSGVARAGLEQARPSSSLPNGDYGWD